MSLEKNAANWTVEVFYDGDCPLCRREIELLRWFDRRRRIRFTNIAASDFDADSVGIEFDDLMSEIHARLPDGRWIHGVEVFRRLYQAVGFGPLVLLSRAPVVSHLLDFGYRVFAKNRLKWTGRCASGGGACPIKDAKSTLKNEAAA